MQILEKLLGGPARLKLLRLFLFNPTTIYGASEIVKRTTVSLPHVRRELVFLKNTGLIKRKSLSRTPARAGWALNEHFPHKDVFQEFLLSMTSLTDEDILRRLGKIGKFRFVVIGGVFIRDPEGRVDLLVVGDGVKKSSLEHAVRLMEAELGKELRYAFFTAHDFRYRMSVYDRFIRDILDYPHRTLLDRLTIGR